MPKAHSKATEEISQRPMNGVQKQTEMKIWLKKA